MMATGCHDTVTWQFSMRAMFVLTGGLAVLIALVTNYGAVYRIGGIEFWIALLAPVWIPFLLFPERSIRARLRPLLALIPIGWYLACIHVWYVTPNKSPVLAFAAPVACVALAMSARGCRHLVNVPLWLAVLAGTVSSVSR